MANGGSVAGHFVCSRSQPPSDIVPSGKDGNLLIILGVESGRTSRLFCVVELDLAIAQQADLKWPCGLYLMEAPVTGEEEQQDTSGM